MQTSTKNILVEEETWGEAFREIRGSTWKIICLLWSRFMVAFRFIFRIVHLLILTVATSLTIFCLVRFIFPFDF